MLSVVITTFNEEPNISAALDSVAPIADDIIVVDSFSTDGTAAIVQRLHPRVRFFQRHYLGPADQKNWAIPQAHNQWVLLMDADERVPPQLSSEIQQIIQENGRGFDGFWIGFTHYFMGQKIRYSGWQNDKTIRLIQRDKCRYNSNQVHEEIEMTGLSIGYLNHKFQHFTYRNIQHFIDKQERYATWSAQDYNSRTGRITYFHLFIKPIFRFLKHFIIKLGFLDGKAGFVISVVAAWSVFLRYVKMMEMRKNGKLKVEN